MNAYVEISKYDVTFALGHYQRTAVSNSTFRA